MGQYYKMAFIGAAKVPTETIGKLMEFSWKYNNAVFTVMKKLYSEIWREFVTIGDYSEDKFGGVGYNELDEMNTIKIVNHTIAEMDAFYKGKFLLNVSKREGIFLEEYFKKEIRKDNFIEHPLPLLTASGNGLGGGDFPRGMKGFKDIGKWAGDKIRVSDKLPRGYRDFTYKYSFNECLEEIEHEMLFQLYDFYASPLSKGEKEIKTILVIQHEGKNHYPVEFDYISNKIATLTEKKEFQVIQYSQKMNIDYLDKVFDLVT